MSAVKFQVHRFGDKVAVYVGTGPTTYLTPVEASKLGMSVLSCADEIEDEPDFSKSKFSTVYYNSETDSE